MTGADVGVTASLRRRKIRDQPVKLGQFDAA